MPSSIAGLKSLFFILLKSAVWKGSLLAAANGLSGDIAVVVLVVLPFWHEAIIKIAATTGNEDNNFIVGLFDLGCKVLKIKAFVHVLGVRAQGDFRKGSPVCAARQAQSVFHATAFAKATDGQGGRRERSERETERERG